MNITLQDAIKIRLENGFKNWNGGYDFMAYYLCAYGVIL